MGIWTRKSIDDLAADSGLGEQKLGRHLGAIQLIMLGIGCIIGAGIFSITGIAAAQNAGPAIVISFLIAGIGCAAASLCYSELAAMIPIAGSAYIYTYVAFGEFIAWLIGWNLILEYAIGAATVAISWSAYVTSFLHDLGITLPSSISASPWQSVTYSSGEQIAGLINLPALFILMVASTILIIGIKQSALINTCMVTIKISIVLLFICIGFFYIHPANYHPFIPENTGNFGDFGWSGILRGAGIVFFAYIGFDAVSTVSQETKCPQRNVPIGIVGSLIICTILYILFSFVLVGLVNYQDINIAAPVISAIETTPYIWLKGLVKLAIVLGLSSVILVMLLGQSRILYAMSCDGFLPSILSKTSPRFQTPWISNLILTLFVGPIAAFVPIQVVGQMTSIGTLFAFAFVCLGVVILRKRDPDWKRPFRTPWVPYVPFFGIAVCFIMMLSLGQATWIRLFVWLTIGIAIYFFYSKKNIALSSSNAAFRVK